MISLGLLAAFGGVLVGLCQNDLKTNLAYSSISQMGVMTVIFGVALGAENQLGLVLSVLAFYALNHGLAKGALFLGTALAPRNRVERFALMGGLGFAALAIAGAPLTAGAWAKYGAKEILAGGPGGWETSLTLLLQLSALGTALLLGRFLWLTGRKWSGDDVRPALEGVGVWGLLLLVLALAPIWANQVLEPPVPVPAFSLAGIVDALWPVLVAALILFAAARLARSGKLPGLPAIPPGDLVVPMEQMIRRLAAVPWWRLGVIYPARGALNWVPMVDRFLGLERVQAMADQTERRLALWGVVGSLFLLIVLIVVFLL